MLKLLLNQEVFLLPSESRVKKNSNKFFISIDLEDFTYDTLRNLGRDLRTNHTALESCYKSISDFSSKFLDNSKFTFFTTGTLAREYPELISKISADGNEISSHYNFHDLMYKQSLDEVEENIIIAKESIKNACGITPRGFRAPAFSINPFNANVYKLLAKHFTYDSSYILNDINDKNYKKIFKEYPDLDLIEFPIVTKKSLRLFNLKSGGTYFRLLPVNYIKSIMNVSLENNFIPQIYLHPYDLLHKKEFMVNLKFFIQSKGIPSGLVSYLRQHQWLSLGNKTTLKKLANISTEYEHLGTYKSYLGI